MILYNKTIAKIPNSEFEYRWYINSVDYVDKIPQILVDKKGHRWFMAVDVIKMLGYIEFSHALIRIANKDLIKTWAQLKRTTKRTKDRYILDQTKFLSEEGVYQVIMKSKKPVARGLKIKYF